MDYFDKLLQKHIDFHFALALVAIFGTAWSVYLQFGQANIEFDTLSGSMSSFVHNGDADSRENAALNQELNNLEQQLKELDLGSQASIKKSLR